MFLLCVFSKFLFTLLIHSFGFKSLYNSIKKKKHINIVLFENDLARVTVSSNIPNAKNTNSLRKRRHETSYLV